MDLQVDPAQIRAHANTVAGLASGLSDAAGAVPAGPAENSLGTFLGFLTAGLGAAMSQTGQAIAQASSAVEAVSSALVRTAEDYERTDDDNAVRLLQEDSR
ncbi:Excreted virulence factor EspC, type VII ESX diderm [Saccharopolyspora kobensis]|uniref:Excreted virulence factor EspC, type VII ESX diderm n=1 Tax=Saccharopolyspora kobensis TaxID=146035 RepID=A0A1H5XTM0_9PSEU|nr:type VII secretion target [Saccharopolyspora kobensis]SEG15084.1 Excreted virulence factor EspC, type VII ESX diderm [Saccharopolyspora kobensis]SFF11422.1 Excreted virulence factor EspC, type VII ESX diderm [Saccharopolyspora kobensis]